MSGSFKKGARPIAVKKEVRKVKEDVPCASAQVEADEICCLSGDKPFFDIILSKSHVNSPFTVHMPVQALPHLPPDDVTMVLTYGDKKWPMRYNGKAKRKIFECMGWRKFVLDNKLKFDDACIFEVMQSTAKFVLLKVMIIRNTDKLPDELLEKIDSRGMTADTAIELD